MRRLLGVALLMGATVVAEPAFAVSVGQSCSAEGRSQRSSNANEGLLMCQAGAWQIVTMLATSCSTGTFIRWSGSAWQCSPELDTLGTVTGRGASTGSNITAGGFFYSSDVRLKRDVQPLTPEAAARMVDALRGVTFRWRADGRADIGLIAQDVEQVVPELALTDSRTGMKAVEYGNIVALLIEARRADRGVIDALERRVEALERALATGPGGHERP